jgi:hypothetical protein
LWQITDAPRDKARTCLVEPADQCPKIGQRQVGHRPCRVRRKRHVALDVRQDLASLVVGSEMPRRTVEPDRLEVEEQRANRLAGRARDPADGVADPDRGVPGVHAAKQWPFVRHAAMMTRRTMRR